MINITFPKLRDDWSLDVVNILAFLGEHNILACSQQICMTWTCLLPRLIPAPQGLLAQRPKKLDSEDDVPVNGVHTGNGRPGLSYVGRMIHTDGSELPPCTTRVIKIRWTSKNTDGSFRKAPLRPRLFSPINIIAIFSCGLSFGLAAWAIMLGDAVALTGILVMSFTTPLLCVGMRWRPGFPIPSRNYAGSPRGTVVVKSANGCFTVVECDEDVARLLYFHPDKIDYAVSSFTGRGLSGTVGGLTLVGSIVLFGNAVWTMKAALAVTYTVLNLCYWIAAILPLRLSWHIDLEIDPPQIIEHETYTRCVWTTIYITKKIDWARNHVPNSDVWDQWLGEAQRMAGTVQEPGDWDAQGAIVEILTEKSKRTGKTNGKGSVM